MAVKIGLKQAIFTAIVLFFCSFMLTVLEILDIFSVPLGCPPSQPVIIPRDTNQDRNTQPRIIPTNEQKVLEQSIESYISYHNKALKQKDISNLKFVVYVENNGGIGNHFLPMVSTLAYAMLTNRIYLQHKVNVSEAPMSSLFKSPFLVVELEDVASKLGTSAERILSDQKTLHISLRHKFSNTSWDYIYCQNTANDKHQFIEIFSNQYFMPTITHNPYFRERVLSLFGKKYFEGNVDLYGPMSRTLFQPLPHVTKMVDDFIRANFRKHMIGVQLRKEFLEFKGWDTLWLNAIEKIRNLNYHSSGIGSQDVGVFLASDYDIKSIKKSWSSEHIVSIDKIPGRSKNAQIFAVVDILLLSKTNSLIITEHSTFGSSAAGFGSVIPFAMTRQGMCRIYLNSQPHCHFCEFVKKTSCFNPSYWYSLDNVIEG